MSKTDFLIKLREMLSGLPQEEVADRLMFYGEMIDDRIEEGLAEEDAVAEVGSVDEIAAQILEEVPVSKTVNADEKEKKENSYSDLKNETIDIIEDFRNIEIRSDTADVAVHCSDDNNCKVTFSNCSKQKHSVEVQDNTLYIKTTNTGKWYEHIAFFSVRAPKIDLFLPRSDYSSLLINANVGDVDVKEGISFANINVSVVTGDVSFCACASGSLNVKSTTGDISVKDISSEEIGLQTSTGDISACSINCAGNINIDVFTGDTGIEKTACKCVTINGATGDIILTDVRAEEKITAKSSFGDLRLRKCDAAELILNSGVGDISASLLTEKRVIAKSSLGDVRVPNSVSGGICNATANTGDIKISIENI